MCECDIQTLAESVGNKSNILSVETINTLIATLQGRAKETGVFITPENWERVVLDMPYSSIGD